MSQDPALPKFEVPIADKSGVTTKNWYFFFSQLLNSITGGVTKIIAGTNVTISPTSGVGDVTINATGGGGSGTVADITSTGGSITITNPTGPTVNLEVTTPGGTGTVTSVSLTDASTTPIFTTGGSGTTAVALTETLKTQAANTVFAGPTTGAAAQPGFRAIVQADLPVTGGIPGTIPDLNLWWESDNILATAGNIFGQMQDRTPWQGGVWASNTSSATSNVNLPLIDTTGINGFPAIKFPAAQTTGILISPFGFQFGNGGTMFAVVKPAAATSATRCIFGGNTGALSFFLQTTASTAKFGLVKSATSVIGTATNVWTAGTAMQINATYNPTTGAFAFRQARTANGSGSITPTTIVNRNTLIGADSGNTSLLNADVLAALICYNRVLTSTEITSVENYLFAKWGV